MKENSMDANFSGFYIAEHLGFICRRNYTHLYNVLL